ncbi:amidohydrolase family protein [Anaeromicropila populeti]|uniref:Amidohydrolase-related domain-containing protein n=1 Tax=Anaeromicropila populeti TaxID=37658 RepID=A0A1I6HU98_9FIRM|nr:amidohydrolase family protein [Anaeromicropila populeti]SFR57988.1 hypothetical protein SAMN05661086_00297 [Anaeromicropila populeti]
MIIDFHTHIFPEAIAERTIKKLEKMVEVKAATNGTLLGLKQSMREAEVDWSVILPVVTKPEQFTSVNEYAASITDREGIISFGGIHPETKCFRDEIDKICEYGLKGIKLHPDFQNTYIDDKKYINIITYALSRNLIVSIHAGVDKGLPYPVHCPPDKAYNMIKQAGMEADTSKIVLAHMGGYLQWDDVEKYLVGTNVSFDISFSFGYMNPQQMVRMIRSHGAEKILFGTDSPWSGQKEMVKAVQQLPLSEKEKIMILGENAKKFLLL